MGRRALSKTKKKQINSELQHEWINISTERYRQDQELPKKNRKGLKTICAEAEAECYAKTRTEVRIASSTVWDRARGKQSIRDFNAGKRWLENAEEEAVVEFAVHTALRGFPLNHRRLKEHVDQICRARLGDQFPDDGVGKEWTNRFVERHSEVLKPYWSHSLDNSRARAVNPNNKEAYFALLEKTIRGNDGEEPIPAELIYGMDETGIQQGVGVKERVLGPAGQKVQYQQRSGDRENITVIATICADGTSLPPAVVFKGDAYQVNWKQDNPLKASLGYSKSGYVDGEIGIEWIKQFDAHTKEKAAGRRRLLLVDGHASHYTYGFLDYARKNNIHVLCYPSHSTHAFQGLDVVIFSVLKRAWTKARDGFERQKRVKVSKRNFLAIYARAHEEALTADNIRAAFRKTGVVPLNRDVITASMMAPSLETSSRGTLPLRQGSPVQALSQLIAQEIEHRATGAPLSSVASSSRNPAPRTPTRTRTHTATELLTGTSAAYLVSPSAIPTYAAPPTYVPTTISPKKRRYEDLLSREPVTKLEAELQAALLESARRGTQQKEAMIGMQAGLVLQGVYVERAHERLEGLEGKGRVKKKQKLMGDGLPHLLDGDEFFDRVVEFEAAQTQKEAEKEQRRGEREAYDEQIEQWKMACAERDARVAAQRDRFARAKVLWEEERDLAKQERRRIGWKKPKLGRVEPVPAKPRLRARRTAAAEEDGEAEDEGEDEDAGTDNDDLDD